MKSTVVSIVIAAAMIGGVIIMMRPESGQSSTASVKNVSIVDGTQIVEIAAKGQYSPKVTAAKADMPTVLRVQTNGTFDCTSQLTVPSIGYRRMLPPTGSTDIELAAQKSGTTVRGICAMGMYNFEVKFN